MSLLSNRFKTTFVLWPRRLLDGKQDGHDGKFKKLGWVWLQRAHLTNNALLGWVAFIEYQTSEYLDHCHVCGKPFQPVLGVTEPAATLTDEQINDIWSAKDTPQNRSNLSPWGLERIRAIIKAARGVQG